MTFHIFIYVLTSKFKLFGCLMCADKKLEAKLTTHNIHACTHMDLGHLRKDHAATRLFYSHLLFCVHRTLSDCSVSTHRGSCNYLIFSVSSVVWCTQCPVSPFSLNPLGVITAEVKKMISLSHPLFCVYRTLSPCLV